MRCGWSGRSLGWCGSGRHVGELGAPGCADGDLGGLDPRWWGELGEAVLGDAHGPAGVVHDAVVPVAEQDDVVQRSDAAVCPVQDVVSGAPGRWPVAARKRATPV